MSVISSSSALQIFLFKFSLFKFFSKKKEAVCVSVLRN